MALKLLYIAGFAVLMLHVYFKLYYAKYPAYVRFLYRINLISYATYNSRYGQWLEEIRLRTEENIAILNDAKARFFTTADRAELEALLFMVIAQARKNPSVMSDLLINLWLLSVMLFLNCLSLLEMGQGIVYFLREMSG